MGRHNLETVGVRRTGWAALDDIRAEKLVCPPFNANKLL